MVVKIILLVIIAILLVLDYALVVIASEADRRADRMYRKWKEEQDEREQKISNR